MKVRFLKKAKVNTKWYEKGDTLNVSQSILDRLIENKEAELVKAKEPKKD